MAFYEEGLYECEIRKQLFSQNKKGTEYFGLSIFPKTRLKDDQRIPKDGPHERTVFLWTNSPENVERTIEQLKALGWSGAGGFTGLNPDAQGYFSFEDQVVQLRCTHNEGNDGKVYDSFQFPILSSGGKRSPENDADIAKRLDRLYKVGKNATKKDRASDSVDEEVPF